MFWYGQEERATCIFSARWCFARSRFSSSGSGIKAVKLAAVVIIQLFINKPSCFRMKWSIVFFLLVTLTFAASINRFIQLWCLQDSSSVSCEMDEERRQLCVVLKEVIVVQNETIGGKQCIQEMKFLRRKHHSPLPYCCSPVLHFNFDGATSMMP